MSYTALYRKFRPAEFGDVKGQDHIITTLQNQIKANRIGHAYLFCGTRGTGKTTVAKIFAKAVNCEHPVDGSPCGECEMCKSIAAGTSMNVIEIDAASNNGVDNIREIREEVAYRPTEGKYKVYIIDEVHMLTTQAFNALLKTLEEPPPYVKFILATTDPLKLPATILSRTQHFRFKQIKNSDVVNHLCHILHLENVEYEKEALEMLSRAGNGSLRDTLTLLDQAIIYSKGFITPSSVATMLGLLDPTQLERIFAAVLGSHRNELLSLIKELESYECDVVIDELIVYLKNAFFEQDRRFSTLLYERFFKILSEAKSLLHINANNGFVLSLVFFKMVEATHIKSIEEMIDSLESEKFRIPVSSLHVKAAALQESPSDEKSEPVATRNDKELFAKLCLKLKDRNVELGTCFEKNITFLAFEETILRLSSRAKDEESTILKHSSGIIKHFVQEIFGLETKIDIVKNLEPLPQEEPSLPDMQSFNESAQSASMIENIEFESEQSESCATGAMMAKEREIDVKEILNDPFIQKAQELFEPRKIEIHPKV